MGSSVVRTVTPHITVIDWTGINLSGVATEILWDTYGRAPIGPARNAIAAELISRHEM